MGTISKAQGLRRIAKTLYPLSGTKEAELRAMTMEQVFAIDFLRALSGFCDELDNRWLSSRLRPIHWKFRGRTFGQVLDLNFGDIAEEFGEGHRSLALFLDVVTALGLSIKGAPKPPEFDRRGVAKHISFARHVSKGVR
jgi:hypothetical protein